MKKFAYVVFGMVMTAGIMFGGYSYGNYKYEQGVLDGSQAAIEEMTTYYAKYEDVINMKDNVDGFIDDAKETFKTIGMKFESLH